MTAEQAACAAKGHQPWVFATRTVVVDAWGTRTQRVRYCTGCGMGSWPGCIRGASMSVTNWVCAVCGWRWYVRPDKRGSAAHTRCPACGSASTERDQ